MVAELVFKPTSDSWTFSSFPWPSRSRFAPWVRLVLVPRNLGTCCPYSPHPSLPLVSFWEREVGGKLSSCLIGSSQQWGLVWEPFADIIDAPLIKPFLTLFSSALSFYRQGMFEVPHQLGRHLPGLVVVARGWRRRRAGGPAIMSFSGPFQEPMARGSLGWTCLQQAGLEAALRLRCATSRPRPTVSCLRSLLGSHYGRDCVAPNATSPVSHGEQATQGRPDEQSSALLTHRPRSGSGSLTSCVI